MLDCFGACCTMQRWKATLEQSSSVAAASVVAILVVRAPNASLSCRDGVGMGWDGMPLDKKKKHDLDLLSLRGELNNRSQPLGRLQK